MSIEAEIIALHNLFGDIDLIVDNEQGTVHHGR